MRFSDTAGIAEAAAGSGTGTGVVNCRCSSPWLALESDAVPVDSAPVSGRVLGRESGRVWLGLVGGGPGGVAVTAVVGWAGNANGTVPDDAGLPVYPNDGIVGGKMACVVAVV